jgi:hypothetical protein
MIIGPGFYDWIYWHFFTITINYNSSQSKTRSIPYWTTSVFSSTVMNDELFPNYFLVLVSTATTFNDDCLANALLSVKVKVTLRLTDRQSVSKSWCRAPSGAHDQIFITVSQLRSCFCRTTSLTRGRMSFVYAAGPASAVFLGSKSLGTRDYILLFQIRDFPFRRLLRLAGSRWTYSTPPPHGLC